MMTSKHVLMAALAALVCVCCGKQVPSVSGKNLGTFTVESDAGAFTVLITGEGVWKATAADAWLGVDEAYHRDDCTIVIRYGSNQSIEGLHRNERRGSVLIMSADGAQCDTITVIQKGLQL